MPYVYVSVQWQQGLISYVTQEAELFAAEINVACID